MPFFLSKFLSLVLLCSAGERPADKLETYNVDHKKISLSGFSSGGFFGVQFHVAFSETIMGAGILAGGPYWCAKGNFSVAKSECFSSTGSANVDDYANKVMNASAAGKIDPPSNLPTDWVYLFSSANDSVIANDVVKNTEMFYRNFVAKGFLMSQYNVEGEHAMLTDNFGSSCETLQKPYINNCNFSVARRFIQAIYNDADWKENATAIDGNLKEFDQSEFIHSSRTSMDSIGYVYIPSACQNKETICRLHVVFHGCNQGRDKIGDMYALHAEYNPIAELNNIIILYPQIKADRSAISNSLGCWDWIGYTNSDYIYKDGLQMATVKRMLDRVAGL